MIYRIASNKLFKAYFMEKDTDKIKLVTPGKSPSKRDSDLVVGATELTDKVVLESLRSTDDGTRTSLCGQLMRMVADRIMRLGLENGSKLVLPTTALLMRGIEDENVGTEMLINLLAKLKEEMRPTTKVKLGISLGDRASHFAAGYLGNSHLTGMMGVVDRHLYAKNMAAIGYNTATNFGTRCGPRTKAMALSVEVLIRRFRDVVDVLTQVLGTEELTSIRQRKSLKGIAPLIG